MANGPEKTAPLTMFAEFGVTMAIAVVLSGAISLSLTPMLCSRMLRPLHGGGVHTILDLQLQSLSHRLGAPMTNSDVHCAFIEIAQKPQSSADAD